MATRTVGSSTRYFLALALLLGACGESGGPTAPDATAPRADDAPFDPTGPETTTPVPGPASFDRSFDVVSLDGCTFPGGPYARFVRRMVQPEYGTHALTTGAGFESCNDAPEDVANSFTWSHEDGTFAWNSTVPVGAVILQSGSASRVYTYGQRSWGDAGLLAPTDPSTGSPLPVDALVVCHDYALSVSAEVQGRFVARTDWSLSAVASGRAWDLFPGDRATASLSVQLTRTGPFNEPATAVGRVTIVNAAPLPARLTSVTNLFTGGLLIPIDFQVTLPYDLAPGELLVGTYAQPLPNRSPRTNTVTVNTVGDVRGGTARAALEFGDRVAETPTATVVSSDGRIFGPFDATTTFLIERVFEAVSTSPEVEEVPWSLELLDDDGDFTTTITVRRHDPRLDLSASTRFTRSWSWTLEHGAYSGAAVLDDLRQDGVPAWVRATAEGGIDSDFGVTGSFAVSNPHPSRALEVDVVVVSVGAHVDAPSGSNWSLDPGLVRTTGFDVDLSGGTVSEGAVVLRYVSRAFSSDGRSIVRGIAEIAQSFPLVFAVPTTHVDATARLGDSSAGDLGVVDAGNGSTVLDYSVPLTGTEPCGPTTVQGQVRLLTADTSTSTAVDYVILLDVDCDDSMGCTRGRGYWRSHPDDPAWAEAARGPRTSLFLSGMTWMDALVRPVRGDPYRQLAAAWVTARLNEFAGADVSTVLRARAEGAELLATHAPGRVAKADAPRWRAITRVLQDFNEGALGPGACPD